MALPRGILGFVRRVEAGVADTVRQVILRVDVARMAVRVVVAHAAPELLRGRVGGGAEGAGRVDGAVLADVLARGVQRAAGGVGLRGQRQVDGALGERVVRL